MPLEVGLFACIWPGLTNDIQSYLYGSKQFFRYGTELRFDIFSWFELRKKYRTVPYCQPCVRRIGTVHRYACMQHACLLPATQPQFVIFFVCLSVKQGRHDASDLWYEPYSKSGTQVKGMESAMGIFMTFLHLSDKKACNLTWSLV